MTEFYDANGESLEERQARLHAELAELKVREGVLAEVKRRAQQRGVDPDGPVGDFFDADERAEIDARLDAAWREFDAAREDHRVWRHPAEFN